MIHESAFWGTLFGLVCAVMLLLGYWAGVGHRGRKDQAALFWFWSLGGAFLAGLIGISIQAAFTGGFQ
jgi:hypothetical protein